MVASADTRARAARFAYQFLVLPDLDGWRRTRPHRVYVHFYRIGAYAVSFRPRAAVW
jgi:hypothetical protein